MTMMMKLFLIIYSTILILKNPMSMGIMLLLQTFLSTLFMSKMLLSSWMPMLMFLMFIGGLMILFTYMSSIASNEMLKFNLKMMLILTILILPLEEMLSEMFNKENQEKIMINEMLTLSKNYSQKTFILSIMTFLYLFITMTSTSMIVKIFKGPLRSK
nr:NADH dehydrogenase subunit 6 [Nelidina sp. n.]